MFRVVQRLTYRLTCNMRKRTRARECALKILYQIDVAKQLPESALEDFWTREPRISKEIKAFTKFLVNGTIGNLIKIDEIISKYADNWELKRMATIDRNILRMSTFELLFSEDVPPKVSINEAVELAKKYGDIDSSRFVNGILDKIKKTECITTVK